MPRTSVLTKIRHTIGRALRETGQALDRVGIRGTTHAESTRIVNDDAYFFETPLSRHRTLMPLLERGEPIIELGEGDHDQVFIAPCSSIIGSVRIARGASIWYGASLRADSCWNGMNRFKNSDEQTKWEREEWITMTEHEKILDDKSYGGNSKAGGAIYIGKGTNVQDGAIITSKESHTIIGDNVTIGHSAQIHSAIVENTCLIGIGSVLKPGSYIESESIVAAGAVVMDGATVKSGEVWAGNPARKLRDLTPEQRLKITYQAEQYVSVAATQVPVMELGGNIDHDSMFAQQYNFFAPVETSKQKVEDKKNSQINEGSDENLTK